jgi:SAM-dependent methyltransferase
MIAEIPVFAVRSSQLDQVIRGIRASHKYNLEASTEDHLGYTAHTAKIHEILCEIISQQFDPARRKQGLTILDVGGGRGELALLFSPQFLTAMIDVDLLSARIAKELQRGVTSFPVLCGDCSRLPIASGSYDIVIAKETSHHMADPARFFRELGRVVRPDGLVIVIEGVLSRFTNQKQAAARDRIRQLGAVHHHYLLSDVIGPLSQIFADTDIKWAMPAPFARILSKLGCGELGKVMDHVWMRAPRAIQLHALSAGGGTAVVGCQTFVVKEDTTPPTPGEVSPYPAELAELDRIADDVVAGIRNLILSHAPASRTTVGGG